MTNYERIKAMSVEEMAYKMSKADCNYCPLRDADCMAKNEDKCLDTIKNWLESESVKLCIKCCNFKEQIGSGLICAPSHCIITKLRTCELNPADDCPFFNIKKDRIAVLPCKVGDTLWLADFDRELSVSAKQLVYPLKVHCIKIWDSLVKLVLKTPEGSWYEVLSSHIGRTIFRSEPEAQKALEEAK